jgi:hypothetical protein
VFQCCKSNAEQVKATAIRPRLLSDVAKLHVVLQTSVASKLYPVLNLINTEISLQLFVTSRSCPLCSQATVKFIQKDQKTFPGYHMSNRSPPNTLRNRISSTFFSGTRFEQWLQESRCAEKPSFKQNTNTLSFQP